MSLTKLKEIVFDRIPVEIFLAHEALGVYMAIAEDSDSLNRSGHRHIFGIIQRHALGAFVLSLCKLFEEPNGRYPNYSIHTALVHLSTCLNDVAVPDQSKAKLDEYIRTEIDSTFSVYDPLKAATTAQLVYTHFEEQCPRIPPQEGKKLDVTLDALKMLRDKRVAHDEDHSLVGLMETDLDSTIELLCLAQTFVNIIGYGFFGFSLKSTAQPAEFAPDRSKSGGQMKKIIQELEQQLSHGRGTAGAVLRR
jgi:hypothetical protein